MSKHSLFWDVDTQHDFMDPEGALYVPEAEQIVPNLDRLSRTAEAIAIPVLASFDDHELSDPELSAEPDFKTTFPPHCVRGTNGAERVAATSLAWTLRTGHRRRTPDEIRSAVATSWPRILIPKKNLDVFSNPNTDLVLDALRPDRIVVYGVALEFCVRCVVEGLLERDHSNIVVLMDATKAIQPGDADMLLRRWRAAGVRLERTSSLLGELDSTARRAVG